MAKTREQCMEEIMESMHSIRRTLASQWIKPGNAGEKSITSSQWTALIAVFRRENLSISELASMLGVTASAATQLVDELVVKGYLVRQNKAEDRRTLSLSLSKMAKKKIAAMKSKRLERFTRIFGVLTDKEIKQYAALNKKISERILNANPHL